MRNLHLLYLLSLGVLGFVAASCSHDNMVTNPNGAMPVITQIQPNPRIPPAS